MSSHGQRKSNGLDLVLLIIFDFVFVNRISASEETCGEINGQILCYFKAWDFGVDWDAAWQLCNSRNATLPAIRNGNEQDVFEKFLNMHMSGSTVWTSGRNYTYDNWTWVDGRPCSNRDCRYILDAQIAHPRYHPVGYSSRILKAGSPGYSLNYICQYSGDVCSYFNDTLNVTNGCIILSDDTRSWYDARNQCLFTGGDLAVLDDADRYRFQDNFERYIFLWIGLRKTSWRWNLNKNASEDDEIKYTNWSKNWNPLRGDCISIDASDGTWSATECSDKLKVVCQTDFVNKTSSKSDNSLSFSNVERESPSVSYPTLGLHMSHRAVSQQLTGDIRIWRRLEDRPIQTVHTLNSRCNHFMKKCVDAEIEDHVQLD